MNRYGHGACANKKEDKKMKVKNAILAFVLGALATTGLASNMFNAFAGLSGGADFFTENKVITYVGTTNEGNDSTGFAGDLKFGGTFNYRAFSLGLVADALAQTGKAGLNYSHNYVKNKFGIDFDDKVSAKGYESMPYSFGVSLQPGLNISDNAEVYMTVGGRIAQFKNHLPTDGIHTDPKGGFSHYMHYGTNTAYNGNFTKWVPGIDAGLGFSSYFTSHLSMDGQYDYTYYFPFTKQTQFAGAGATKLSTVAIKYKPFTSRISLALTYHFLPENFNKREYAHPVAWLNSIGLSLPGSHPVATA
jgi:hypothetical protein